MAYFTYNGIALQVESFQRFDQRAVYSDDGADYLYTEFTVILRSLWHSKATSDSSNNAGVSMNSLRASLMAPRKQLIVSAPIAGATGMNGSVFLRSPLLKPGGASSYYCDAKNGPQPLFCNIQEIVGEDTMIVDYGIITWVNECPGSGTGSATPISPVLSHRWAMSHLIDDKFNTRRIVAGTAVLRTDLVFDANGVPSIKPDDFRDYFFHVVPPNYKRVGVQVEASSDGSRLQYVVEDQEVHSVVDPSTLLSPLYTEIADIDGYYMEATDAAEGFSPSELLKDFAAGAVVGTVIGGPFTPALVAAAVAVPVYKAVSGLFPTKTFKVVIDVVGTRRSTRAGLVQSAIRAAINFNVGNPGGTGVLDITRVLENLVQNFMVSNVLVVGLVNKTVHLECTYRGSAVATQILQAAGTIQLAVTPRPVWGPAGPLIPQSLGDILKLFRANNDTPSASPTVNIPGTTVTGPTPLSAYNPNFPNQLDGVTKANSGVNDTFGPRGGSLISGLEKNSRGTTITHLLTSVLNAPCAKPAAPTTPGASANTTSDPNNKVRF